MVSTRDWHPEQEPKVQAALAAWKAALAEYDAHALNCDACWFAPLRSYINSGFDRNKMRDNCPEGERLKLAERNAVYERWTAYRAAIEVHEKDVAEGIKPRDLPERGFKIGELAERTVAVATDDKTAMKGAAIWYAMRAEDGEGEIMEYLGLVEEYKGAGSDPIDHEAAVRIWVRHELVWITRKAKHTNIVTRFDGKLVLNP